MDLYLLIALFLIYMITAVLLDDMLLKRIWLLAFAAGLAVCAVAIVLLKSSGEEVMMSGDNFNWYYLLYLFGSISIMLGVINAWMYRRELWHLLRYGDSQAPKNMKE